MFNLFRLNLKDKYSWGGGGRKRMVGKKNLNPLDFAQNQYIYSCILNNQVSHKGRIHETCANKIFPIPITVLVHIGKYQI